MEIVTPETRPSVPSDVEIRPLTGADRDGLARAFSHLSEQTRWRRFGSAASALSARDLDRLTDVDHRAHEALAAVASDTGEIVGVARYIVLPSDPGAAEVAIEVDDDWQRRGVGRRLMSELVARARVEGIARLVAYVSTDNYPVLGWIARSGGTVQSRAGDATVYSIPLERLEEMRTAA